LLGGIEFGKEIGHPGGSRDGVNGWYRWVDMAGDLFWLYLCRQPAARTGLGSA
jgi:hypothetical protein